MTEFISVHESSEGPSVGRCDRTDIAEAIRRDQFIPFYQPKVNLRTGAVDCVEMLARWEHPTFGILLPGRFIPFIERSDLMALFTSNLLYKSLTGAAGAAAKNRKLGIAVNLSPYTLTDLHTAKDICAVIADSGIAFEQITIEVTETASPDDSRAVVTSLKEFRSRGCMISIDDFGTGYSSLALLNKIPFTELKIDKMFTAGISKNKKCTSILESIVDLACRLDLATVAEGIETCTQLEFVRRLGCDTAQGFLLGSPRKQLDDLTRVIQV